MRRVQFAHPVNHNPEVQAASSPHNLVPPSTPDQSCRGTNPSSNSRNPRRAHAAAKETEGSVHGMHYLQLAVIKRDFDSLDCHFQQPISSVQQRSDESLKSQLTRDPVRISSHHSFTPEEDLQKSVLKKRLEVVSLSKLPRTSLAASSKCFDSAAHNPSTISFQHPVYSLSPQFLKPISKQSSSASDDRSNLKSWPVLSTFVQQSQSAEAHPSYVSSNDSTRVVTNPFNTISLPCPACPATECTGALGLQFIPPGCELALEVFATVCHILEEQEQLKHSYETCPSAAFPKHMLNYYPVPHLNFSVYNLRRCDSSSSGLQPKTSSWTEAEEIEDMIYRVTVTENGALFKTPSKRFTHFISLEQFKAEIKAFVLVRALTLFGKFRLVKSMQLWKREARFQVFNRHLDVLGQSLRWQSSNLVSCVQFTQARIFNVQQKLEQYKLWNIPIDKNSSANLAFQMEFDCNELQQCDTQVQLFISCCKTWFKNMVEDIASFVKSSSRDYLSARHEPHAQFKLTSTLDIVRAIRHEDLIKKLLPFVKVCSYMIESAKLQFCITSSLMISANFSSRSESSSSLFFVNFLPADDASQFVSQSYIMNPSKELVCQWFRTRHSDLMSCFQDSLILTSRDDIIDLFTNRTHESGQARRSWLAASECFSHDFRVLVNQQYSDNFKRTLDIIAQGLNGFENMKLSLIEAPLESRAYLASIDLSEMRQIFTSLFSDSRDMFFNALSCFSDVLSRIYLCQEHIHRCYLDSSLICVGWCTLNMVQFLSKLDEFASSRIIEIESCISDCFHSTLFSLKEQLDMFSKEFSLLDTNPANFASITSSLARAPERLFNIEESLRRVETLFSSSSSHVLTLSDLTSVVKRHTDYLEEIRLNIESCSEWHSIHLKSVVNCLFEEQESIRCSVEELNHNLASSHASKPAPSGNQSDFENVMASLDFFEGVSSILVIRGNDLEVHDKIIVSNGKTQTRSRPDLQISKLISDYKLVWSAAYEANQFWLKHSAIPVAAISIDVFSEELAKVQLIKSRCEESPEIMSLPVYKSLSDALQSLCQIIPLARKFQSKTLTDTHWSLISRIVAAAYLQIWASDSSATEGLGRMSSDSDSMDIQRGVALTLNECISWDLCNSPVNERISQVVLESEVQHKLDSSVQEQTFLWTHMTFQFEARENTMLFCSLDAILDLLDESQSSLQSILSSKFSKYFADQCQTLSINLSRVRTLIKLWSNLQDLCYQMEALYSSNEFRTFCTRGVPIFERERRRWTSCVEVVANRPSVFYACGLYDLSGEVLEDTDLYDAKQEYAMSLQEGFLAARQEAVAYLDSKRLSWPRLFAVSTETLMLAVSQPIPCRNSFWPQLFLSVFSSVEMVTNHQQDACCNSVSSSVTLIDRTKLSLSSVLNFDEKIELWLRSLSEAIASRMLDSVKTVLFDFGFKGSAQSSFMDLSLPPAKGRSQIIGICDWAIWCRRISLALPECVLPAPSPLHITGFGSKSINSTLVQNMTLSSGQQRSAINNLEAVSSSAIAEIESCSFHVNQPNVMMHHVMLQLQRMLSCVWVRDLITDILSSSDHSVIDSRCWAWLSVVRYHVDNCEPDFLTVRICDEVSCFGYEVITQAAGHSTFPILCMTDRMRLICNLAASASACIPSTLIGPCASGKATTINFLASLYGRFVATLPCCESLENLAVDRFLGLVLHSSSVATVCCIKDIDSLQLHVLSHLCASLCRINSIISERARAHTGARLNSLWFLCCTMSSQNISKNTSHVIGTFSRTTRIIDVDRVALAACILSGFGFSSAQCISQKLHVFFHQLSASIQSPNLAAHICSFEVVCHVLHLIVTSWHDTRSERERSGVHQPVEFDASAREVSCVMKSLRKVFVPLQPAFFDSFNFSRILSASFGILESEPSLVIPSLNTFPSSFDQYQVLFNTVGVDCNHHLEAAINMWNFLMNSLMPSPFVILVGPDGSGRNFTLALLEVLSIHFSQIRFNIFSICSSQGNSTKLLQRILQEVDRSSSVSLFDCAMPQSDESEFNLYRSSKPLPADVSTWLVLFLQSCVLAQNFGNGRTLNLFDRIRSSAKYVTIESGVTIIERHARNKYIYIIVSGIMSLSHADNVWSVGSGHVLGDFAAINGLKSVCSAVSASKCSLVMVPSHVFFGDAAVVDNEVKTISKMSHCLIVADAFESASFVDCLALNSDSLSYTTWGADGCSWQRNLKLSTSIVIKCNDIHHHSPASISRCAIVVCPFLNADSQICAALKWLRQHTFSTAVGSNSFNYIASLFHNHVSCCISFFLKLEIRTVCFSAVAKTASQLLVCVCASLVHEQGNDSLLNGVLSCTCGIDMMNKDACDFISIPCSRKLPSVQKILNSSNHSIQKCRFCSFKLSPLLSCFIGDWDTSSVPSSSIKMFWANMVAFCVLHSARGLIPSDCTSLNLFERHAKNGFSDVVFRSSSVFDWCISTTFPFMTSLGKSELCIGQDPNLRSWRSQLSDCNLIQEIFVPTNHSRNSLWLAQCWFNGGLSCVIFDGHRSCGKSALAQYVAECFASDSKSAYRRLTQTCAQNFFSHPLEYLRTKRHRNSELPNHFQSVNVHSIQDSQYVIYVDDVHTMPVDIHMGIRSLQLLRSFWFFDVNRKNGSTLTSIVNIPSKIVLTKTSQFDCTAAMNNFALTLTCSDFSNVDNLKSIYSVLAHVCLQSASIPASELLELIDNIANACLLLHTRLQGMDFELPFCRLISQSLQGILECGDFLNSRDETVRVFCHEIIHSFLDGTSSLLLDSDHAAYLYPQIKSSSTVTFSSIFRIVSSSFPGEDLKETEFLRMNRIYDAPSVEMVSSAASRRCRYSARSAIDAISVLQDSASQLLADDNSLRNTHNIDFLNILGESLELDNSARNFYGFSEDCLNVLRFIRALRCRGSHIVVTNSSFLKNHIIPLAAFHSGLEIFVLSAKPSLHYDRADAISDMRQIFEAAVFHETECVVVLNDLHLNCNTWDIFLSAIYWVDTIGHACFDENWLLEQSRRFVDSSMCGYTSHDTIKNMKTRFIANFHAIFSYNKEDTQKMIEPLSQLNSIFRICLIHSQPAQLLVEASAYVVNWLQQFRWDHWSNGLCLRNLYNSHKSCVLRNHRDSLHIGLSSRVVSLLSSLNIGYEHVLSSFLSPSLTELKILAERALDSLQSSVNFLQWFFQVNSDAGVCPDYMFFSLPNDVASFCISVFNTCASTIDQSNHARAINFNISYLSIFIAQVIDSIEKQTTICFNRLFQLEAAIRFSFECTLIGMVLAPFLDAAKSQHQIAASNLSKFEEEESLESDCANDPSTANTENDQHAVLMRALSQSTKKLQQLSSIMTFCEIHTHISIKEMSSEAFALTSSIVRIIPNAALQQALLIVGSVIEDHKLHDLLSAVIPVASSCDRLIRLNSKIEFPDLPSYNFELIQLLPFHALVKFSPSWTFDFTNLLSEGDAVHVSMLNSGGMVPSIVSSQRHISIKDISAFIRISSVVRHLGTGPKSRPILVLDPQDIFSKTFVSLFSIEDVCVTTVDEGHNSLAFARSVLTAVRGGLCLIVQGFSCSHSIGAPKLLLNLINKNFSTDGYQEHFLKLDPDTKSMASVLGIPSSRDVPIHPSFSLILVCSRHDFLSPHHCSMFNVVSLEMSHHLLTGMVSNCILQQQKDAYDRYFSSIKSICGNLQLSRQGWESIILDSAQASGNFSYGGFAFKSVSQDSIDDGWCHVIEVCLRDPNALINQESVNMRLQHKLLKDRIATTMKEFFCVLKRLGALFENSSNVAQMIAHSMKACPNDNFINLSSCFDRIILFTQEFQGNFAQKTKISSEKELAHYTISSFCQAVSAPLDDEPTSSDGQDDRLSKLFSEVNWDQSLFDSIEIDIRNFITASLTETQRLSFSVLCAWHKAKVAGHVSEEEWIVLTCSDEELEEAWASTIDSTLEISDPASANVTSNNHNNLVSQSLARIKSKLLQPSIRSHLEAIGIMSCAAKSGKHLRKLSNFLPSDSTLHGAYLIAVRVNAPHLYSYCVQEFVRMYSGYLVLNEKQLLMACKSVQATIICTSLPHSCIKSSLIQLCPDCCSLGTSSVCVHFLTFDCKHFEGVEYDKDSSEKSHSEVAAIPGFPLGRLHSALGSAISDAIASGKGLIVLHATSYVYNWKGYLRHLAIVSNNSNSNQLSKLVLICDSKIDASCIRAVAQWSRIVFWNFPLACEVSDSFGTGILWVLRNFRQYMADTKIFMVEILSNGKAAVSFQEQLFLRIIACLFSFALAVHTRSCIESGFFSGRENFDILLFFNHSVSIAVSMLQNSRLCDTKAAFASYGIPWLRHQIIFGFGLQLATTTDVTQVMNIFDSLISPDIVNDDFSPAYLEAGVFPSLHSSNDIISLVTSIADSKNHDVDVLRFISLLTPSEWHRLQYCWTQELLYNCFLQNCDSNEIMGLPQLLLSKAEVIQLLQHVQSVIPSIEAFSSLLDSHHQHDFGCVAEQLFSVAVSEATVFSAALVQTRTFVQQMLENVSRSGALSTQEDADFQVLMRKKAPERWCKLFRFHKVMSVSEFVTSISKVASFWSSWPAHKSRVTPVLHANCFKNFGQVLQCLALGKAASSGCNLRDIKCIVLPEANKSCEVDRVVRVQGLIARGFGWNGRVALPISDAPTNSEESSARLKRRNLSSFKRKHLVLLGEVSIVAMSTRDLQESFPHTTATLHSMPVLRDGFDSHEVDGAPLITFLFNKPTNSFMCVFC